MESFFSSMSITETWTICLAAVGVGCLMIGFLVGRLSCGGAEACSAAESSGEGSELYVGNLSYDIKERELEKTFAKFGTVLSTRIIANKSNGRSKGYGFVEMAGQAAAAKAVKAMHGKEISGRKLVVNEARSKSKD